MCLELRPADRGRGGGGGMIRGPDPHKPCKITSGRIGFLKKSGTDAVKFIRL